jgi:type IV secretion system protein VirD4
MNTTIKTALFLAYACAGLVASAYLAALGYFLINRAIPAGIGVDTWYRYWTAYSADPVQHKRLVGSAMFALTVVYIAPLVMLAKFRTRPRSLHGDARWATENEVKKAGLL